MRPRPDEAPPAFTTREGERGDDDEPSGLDPERTRALLFQAARRVTSAVRREWRRDPKGLSAETGMGADGTPTKRIDQLAEDVVLDALKASGLELNVVSEECGYIDNGAEHTLVVDPVDGTRNAVHGIPFYCIAIAVGKKQVSDLEYALVRNISNDDTYWARQGHGATLNGEPVGVRPLDEREILISAVLEDQTDIPRSWTAPNVHVRDMGSCALEMALVAAGSFDAFAGPGRFLRVVDIAASTLLIREAGGEVRTWENEPLDMPFDVKARTSVLAVSSPRLLEVLR